MPLLEAFAAGTPVLCGNTTSLPEVGGDAVLACDPTDPGAMSELMARVLTDRPLRDRLTARGRERLASYNLHASAAPPVAACRRVQERSAVSAAVALRPLERLSRLVQGREEECAARLEVIHRLEDPLRQVEAEQAPRLAVMQRLQEQCAERLGLVQRLEAEAAARLDACQRLAAALECSRAECADL